MLKRLRRILELSKYDTDKLDITDFLVEQASLKPEGEPNGTFIEDMSETEYAEWRRDHDLGWQKFKDLVNSVIK